MIADPFARQHVMKVLQLSPLFAPLISEAEHLAGVVWLLLSNHKMCVFLGSSHREFWSLKLKIVRRALRVFTARSRLHHSKQ